MTRLAVVLLAGCGPVTFSDDEVALIASLSPVPELPASPTNAVADDPDAAALGQALFFSTALSASGDVSCATCHDPGLGFSDGLPQSVALGTTPRHAPHLFNLAWSRWLYWDGRRDSLWSQAISPLEAQAEHGLSRLEVTTAIAADEALASGYEAVFGPLPDASGWPARARPVPDEPDHPDALAWADLDEADREAINTAFSNTGKAIEAYERLLVTGPAPFDAFAEALLAGDDLGADAIDNQARRGLQLFVGDAGCIQCHSGPLLTDHAFHNIGLGPRSWLDEADRGRWDGLEKALDNEFNGAGAYSDDPEAATLKLETAIRDPESLGGFKTPGLRNIALSAPYMHGGHFETLEEVVEHYDQIKELPLHGHREEILLELGLSGADRRALVAFLESLTGALPDEALLTAP